MKPTPARVLPSPAIAAAAASSTSHSLAVIPPASSSVSTPAPQSEATNKKDYSNVLDGFILPPPADDTTNISNPPIINDTKDNDSTKPSSNYGALNNTEPLISFDEPQVPPSKLVMASAAGPSMPSAQPFRNPSKPSNKTTDRSPLLEPGSNSTRYTPRPAQHSNIENSIASSIKQHTLTIKNIVTKLPGQSSASRRQSRANVSSSPSLLDEMYTSDEQSFIDWLDGEFLKIQVFYKTKEDDSIERYLILQDQLFNLREQKYSQKFRQNKRAAAIAAANANANDSSSSAVDKGNRAISSSKIAAKKLKRKINKKFDLPSLPAPLHNFFFRRKKQYFDDDDDFSIIDVTKSEQDAVTPATVSSSNIGGPSVPQSRRSTLNNGKLPNTTTATATSTATTTASPSIINNNNNNNTGEEISPMTGHTKDYTKRIRDQKISYGVARRQLKLAVVELYRELEMLKSYRSLNQTGMRKMIKKFDKVTNHHALPGYMAKVNQSYLCQSDVLEDLIKKTEDMFALYFENGSHKHAVEKLRANTIREEHYLEMFITGLCFGLSVPLAARATWIGIKSLNEGDPDALFMFQIWGGFFLIVLMFSLFAINCVVWTKYKVNYPFVFEFNPLNHLDSMQVGTIPAVLMFFLSLLGWLSFENFWPDGFRQIYYPPIFLGFSLMILFWPWHGFHTNARKWLSVAFWRVFFSGFYPVEFRDLIMGDISCSLTYSISNAAFFFCLYATHWSGLLPGNTSGSYCGSSHSRWMGFLSSLPGIWRFLQCGRRFLDSGDAFPHLANMAKYSLLISYNAFLSAYRINLGSDSLRSLFILFASLNTIYSSFWDLFMDWSLMQITSKNILLRDELAFKSTIPYYTAMVVDPILRCNWVFYAIYANEVQQSAKVSFFVALAELLRRFLWVFFRVENEHCSNVLRFRASRDITLPYTVIKRKHGEPETPVGPPSSSLLRPTRPEDEESRIPGTSPAISTGTSSGGSGLVESTTGGIQTPGLTTIPSATQPGEGEGSFTLGGPIGAPAMPNLSFGSRLYRLVEPVLHAVGNTLQSAHVRDFERRKEKPKDPDDHSNVDSDEEDDDEEEEFFDEMSQMSGRSNSSARYSGGEDDSFGGDAADRSDGGVLTHRSSRGSALASPNAAEWRSRFL